MIALYLADARQLLIEGGIEDPTDEQVRDRAEEIRDAVMTDDNEIRWRDVL